MVCYSAPDYILWGIGNALSYILVTNDDGVQAPGLLALVNALRSLGEVRVIAPAVNQSAIGHKKTLFQDIRVTPATCWTARLPWRWRAPRRTASLWPRLARWSGRRVWSLRH